MNEKYRGIDFNTWSPEAITNFMVDARNQDFKLMVIDNMETYGGSFVKALAECMRRADRENLYKLASSFTNYIVDYQPHNFQEKGINLNGDA